MHLLLFQLEFNYPIIIKKVKLQKYLTSLVELTTIRPDHRRNWLLKFLMIVLISVV